MAQIQTLLLCTCEGTQSLDAESAKAATGVEHVREVSHLCTSDIDVAAKALQEGETLIACAQMASLFDDLAADLEVAAPRASDSQWRAIR